MEHIRPKIVAFLEDDENSFPAPGKRDCVTKYKNKKQKHYLRDSLFNLHKKFILQTKIKISFATFYRCKPFWITRRKISSRDTCLCKKHANFTFLFEKCKLYKFLSQKSLTEFIESLTCDKNNKNCMYGDCTLCQDRLLFDQGTLNKSEKLFFYEWVTEPEDRIVKGKEVKVKVTKKIKKYCTVEQLMEKLKSSLLEFLQHAYRVWHQLSFSKNLKSTIKLNEIFMTIDFSENAVLKYAEETQSVHFGASKQQLTLHTGGFYYKTDVDSPPSVKTFCSISTSLRHDPSAIWAHLLPIFEKIKTEFPQVDTVHIMSDGPTTQYRNKKNFFLFEYFMKKYNFSKATYNFSECGHGKSIADGVGGLIKRTADQAVAHGKDVHDIETFVDTVKHTKTEVFVIQEDQITVMDKLFPEHNLKAIPQTMKLHQLAWSINNEYRFNLRALSCLRCRNEYECCHFTSLQKKFFSFQLQDDDCILLINYVCLRYQLFFLFITCRNKLCFETM